METGSGEMINVVNRSLIIDGLMEFTNYSVEVTAVTVGEGPYSDPVTVITDQDSKYDHYFGAHNIKCFTPTSSRSRRPST